MFPLMKEQLGTYRVEAGGRGMRNKFSRTCEYRSFLWSLSTPSFWRQLFVVWFHLRLNNNKAERRIPFHTRPKNDRQSEGGGPPLTVNGRVKHLVQCVSFPGASQPFQDIKICLNLILKAKAFLLLLLLLPFFFQPHLATRVLMWPDPDASFLANIPKITSVDKSLCIAITGWVRWRKFAETFLQLLSLSSQLPANNSELVPLTNQLPRLRMELCEGPFIGTLFFAYSQSLSFSLSLPFFPVKKTFCTWEKVVDG